MSVELMTNVAPPPPPPPPLPQFNATDANSGGRLPVLSNPPAQQNKTVPLVNFQTNGNTNNSFAILCDEIKNGVKLKKCPVNSDGIAVKHDYVVNNESRHTRSSSLDGNTDNQVVGENKDPKMVSVQAELIRRLQRRNEGIDDDNQEQKILSPTLAMFVQNKTKPLKRDEAQEENSPKMISHAKRNFTVCRKNYSNGVSSSLQSSPNSSEMDLSSDKSLSQTDLCGKYKIPNGIDSHKPVEIKIEPAKLEIKTPLPPVTQIEPVVVFNSKSTVKNSSPTPFTIDATQTTNMPEVTKPLSITISSYTNKSPDHSNTILSPKSNHVSPIPMKSPSLSSPIEHIPAEEKALKKVSELCKTYNCAADNNTKVNDNFVHLNGNLTLKRPKNLPQTHQKISHGKPNYITQSSLTTTSQHHPVATSAPKSPVIHKTEVNIQPTMVNEPKITTPQIKNQNFVSFSKELSSSPNRYTDTVVTTKLESATNHKTASNIMADLDKKQFIKDLIVDDLLEVKNIQFSIDPEKNDITIDLKIGMHLNPRNLN